MEQSQISVQRKVVQWCQLAQSKTWFMFSSHFYLILQFLDKKEVSDHIISVLSISFSGLPMCNILSPDSLTWALWPFLCCPLSCLFCLLDSVQIRILEMPCYFLHYLYSKNLLILFFSWLLFFFSHLPTISFC